jgi:transposase-like protein
MELPPCPHCQLPFNPSDPRPAVVRFGYFVRGIDKTLHRRYRCKGCRRTFSDATFSIYFGQKKRHVNEPIFRFLASAGSQRRLGVNLKVNRKTVVRKFLFLGQLADGILKSDRFKYDKSKVVEFDDLETFEHSNLKPVSVLMMVESKSRRILGFNVAQMPSKGKVAGKSRAKYGQRKDERGVARNLLFQELAPFIEPDAVMKSDQHPNYAASVKKYFPNADFRTFQSRRARAHGQGELKQGRFDPLFSINHTFAMMRANINRLVRRTWNTTKKRERLYLHLAIYTLFHNWVLIPKKKRPKSPLELLTSASFA